jgi:hypothetical protein
VPLEPAVEHRVIVDSRELERVLVAAGADVVDVEVAKDHEPGGVRVGVVAAVVTVDSVLRLPRISRSCRIRYRTRLRWSPSSEPSMTGEASPGAPPIQTGAAAVPRISARKVPPA